MTKLRLIEANMTPQEVEDYVQEYQIDSTEYLEDKEVGSEKQMSDSAYGGVGYATFSGAFVKAETGETVLDGKEILDKAMYRWDNCYSDEGVQDIGAYEFMGSNIKEALDFIHRDSALELDDLDEDYDCDTIVRSVDFTQYKQDFGVDVKSK